MKYQLALICNLLFLNQHLASAQKSSLNMMFGINVIKPVVKGNSLNTSRFSYNFWLGGNFRRQIDSNSAVNIGFFTNGVNYRFASADSPQVTFLTMNYLSLPIQMEWMLKKSHFSVLAGIEPKCYITGHSNTWSSGNSRFTDRITFANRDGLYNRYNIGLRAGFSYRRKGLTYFLQMSSDLLPFRTYETERFFDNKIIFGFTFFPITLRK